MNTRTIYSNFTVNHKYSPKQYMLDCYNFLGVNLKFRARSGTLGLQGDLRRMDMSDSDVCPMCGSVNEDVVHFLFECPQYESERTVFFYEIHQMYINEDADYLYNMFLAKPNFIKAINILDAEPNDNSLNAHLDVILKSFLKTTVHLRFQNFY